MKVFIGLLLSLLVCFKAYCQCCYTNPTQTITGLHSSLINPSPGTVIYIASTATVTGEIVLNNASICNFGLILSPKISMRRTNYNGGCELSNCNILKTDSIEMDSNVILWNHDSIYWNYLGLKNKASFRNHRMAYFKEISVETGSDFFNVGWLESDYIRLKGNNSTMLGHFGSYKVNKLLSLDTNSFFYGQSFVCVDSAFVNKGVIDLNKDIWWATYINVMGTSQNYGHIADMDFCDYSSTVSGNFDLSVGTSSNVAICPGNQNPCNFYSIGIIEKVIPSIKIGIYPDPASSELFIIDNDKYDLENAKLEIYNTLGQIVFSQRFESKINVSDLTQGFYSLRIKQKSGQILYSNFIKE